MEAPRKRLERVLRPGCGLESRGSARRRWPPREECGCIHPVCMNSPSPAATTPGVSRRSSRACRHSSLIVFSAIVFPARSVPQLLASGLELGEASYVDRFPMTKCRMRDITANRSSKCIKPPATWYTVKPPIQAINKITNKTVQMLMAHHPFESRPPQISAANSDTNYLLSHP